MSAKVPVPFTTPMTNKGGTPSLPWQTYFQSVLQGVTGPAGPTGATGATGAGGATGEAGARGSIWFSGSGNPVSFVGQLNGDMYLDSLSGNVWQLLSGTWTFEVTLTAIVGEDTVVDGGTAASNYGGSSPIDGGTA